MLKQNCKSELLYSNLTSNLQKSIRPSGGLLALTRPITVDGELPKLEYPSA